MSSFLGGGGSGGGGGTPGGVNTDIQFNHLGTFGGDGGFTYAGAGGPITITPAANNNPFNISSGVTSGSGIDVIGAMITGTLNTSGNVDGAALFANITNTNSGANSTALDIQVNGASIFNVDMLGDVFLSGDRVISSSTGLTIKQLNDSQGPTSFFLANRTGVNGAVFQQQGNVSVVDFVFLINGSGISNGQSNMRYERRPLFFTFGTFLGWGNNATNEFQIGQPYFGSNNPTTSPYLIAGDGECGCMSATATFTLRSFTNKQAILNFQTSDWPAIISSIKAQTNSAGFITTQNTVFEMQFTDSVANVIKLAIGDTVTYFHTKPQFALNTTGGGTPLFGSNCPAVTLTAPYTWLEMVASDGSLVYVPAWK